MPCRWRRLRRSPAVSTSTNVRSPCSSTVSTVSRVVPGTAETRTRSWPSRRFRRLDLPTFGRPRIATRTASSPTGARPPPGSRSTMVSSRSPVPCPWRPESGTGSPRPSRWNSSAFASWAGSSILFAIRITGLRERRRMPAISSSPGVMPDCASTTKRTRSASAIAACACSAMPRVIGDGSAMSTPPVSTSRNSRPDHSQISSLRSRVTPGVSCTTAAREPVSRLISVDFPTLGKPTIATVPSSPATSPASPDKWLGVSFAIAPSHFAQRSGRWSRVQGATELVHVHQEVPQRPDRAADLARGLAVALAVRRQAAEVHRLAPGDRDRVEVSELPELAAGDRGGHDRDALLQRDHRGAALRLARHAALLPRPFDEEPDGAAVRDELTREAHRLAVGLPAPDGVGAEGADQLAHPRHPVQLDLGHVVDRPRRGGSEGGRVDPREVIQREDDAALQRDVLGAVHPEGRNRLRQRLERHAADRPDCLGGAHQAGSRSRTSSSMRVTTSSISSSVVSIR